MKLIHQMNIAFGVSLVLVLSIAAVMIHYVLMNHFIETQKEEMKTVSQSMAVSIAKFSDVAPIQSGDAHVFVPATTIPTEAILTDRNGNIVEQTFAYKTKPIEVMTSDTVKILQRPQNEWNQAYITEIVAVPEGTLTLRTPLSKIREIEQVLLGRLLIVFGFGAALMFLLSLLITKKLMRPLMDLNEELKKVKQRRFSDVKFIRAGGEIGSVARTVFDMAAELHRFNRVQKQFVQNASHELKTPLMSIAGYAEGIRDGVFEGESMRKGLDIIMDESARLTKIVTEMTLLAKLDSEEDVYRTELVDLKDLIRETMERMNPLLVQKGLVMHPQTEEDGPVYVAADRDKLLQALLNVVSNAARYAAKNIYIRLSRDQEGWVRLAVADDGQGFDETILPYLFHRFVKGKDGESGLGLAISRAIVERSNGEIAARNNTGGGAVITMTFPPGHMPLKKAGFPLKYRSA